MKRTLATSVVLFGLWVCLSGHYGPFLITLGVISSLAVAVFARYLQVLPPLDEKALSFSVRALVYYQPWLVIQIIKSNIDVARRIWQRRMPISPTVIRVRASQRTALGRVTHANSITLTPGTLTLDALENEIEVHALAADLAAELTAGEIDRRVTALERRA